MNVLLILLLFFGLSVVPAMPNGVENPPPKEVNPVTSPTPAPSEMPKTSPPLNVKINMIEVQIATIKAGIRYDTDPAVYDHWVSELARLESELAELERQKAELEAAAH